MTTTAMERRTLPMADAELRIEEPEEEGPGRLVGYAAVFNSRSRDLGGFREIIRPGAFDDALIESDIRALFNHEPDNLLGREGNGTLSLQQDSRGLKYVIELDDTQIAQFVRQKVSRGDLKGSSFTFNVPEDGDEFETRGGVLIREVRTIDRVGDVGPVTFEAYEATQVSARSYRRALETVETVAGIHGAESRQTDQDVRDRIRRALQEQFGGEDVFIWIEATFMEEGEVVYRREDDGGESQLFRIGFEEDEEGSVSLGEPTEVQRVTTFEAVEDEEERSARERDRDERRRLEVMV